VLPLHYPVAHRRGMWAIASDEQLLPPKVWTGCSCRDPACGQTGKHPIGKLVPHGLTEATTNRARVLAWWTRYPLANIGLATGHRFDVLDVDGPDAVAALRAFADRHDFQLPAGGPVVRSGRPEGGWHYYLAPARLGRRHGPLDHVDYLGAGGYVVAPPSRHAAGHPYRWARDLDHPLPELPVPLRELLRRPAERPVAPVFPLPRPPARGDRYGRAALAMEVARVATAPKGERNQQLWTSARNLYNLVAAGVLDDRDVHQGLLQAAERCGLLAEEPRQTHRTLASGRQVGLAHPRRPLERPAPERTPTNASPAAAWARGERTTEGR
jgi:hypothetical protein